VVAHHLTALIVAGPFDAQAAAEWDVAGVALDSGGLWLFHLDHYWSAYWQARRGSTAMLDVPADFPPTFPRQAVVADLAAALTDDTRPFALVMTDYFGGAGGQWACVLTGGHRAPAVSKINNALHHLGVRSNDGRDEFDTVGLGRHRRAPESLERYPDLCVELGV
jgi:hypothetical protein